MRLSPSRPPRRGAPLFLGLGLLLPSFGAPAQEPGVPTVQDLLARADAADLPSVLEVARALGRGAREDGRLRESVSSAVEAASPVARCGLGVALAEAGEVTGATAALLPLLEPGAPEEVTAATVTLLGLPPFPSDAAAKKEIAKKLVARLDSGETGAHLRRSIASSLFAVGAGAEKTRARDELQSFLKSEDPELRAEGALALGAVGAIELAREELKRLSFDPTIRGQLARAYLDQEVTDRYYTRQLKKQREFYDAEAKRRPAKPFDPGDPGVLEEVIKDIQQYHIEGEKFTRDELVAAAARGMLGLLDPHSTLFTGEEFKRFTFELKPEYGGIGAFVRTIGGIFTIVRPIYSGPAYAIGLRSGDRVIAVDGWDTRGHGEDEIIKRLKGKPGTTVKVKIVRQGWPEPRDFEIGRAEITVPVLQYELLPAKIGYVELVGFAENSAAELDRACADLKARGMKGLILDLRNNEGGLLKSAIEVASRFLPKGKLVVTTEGERDGKEVYESLGALAIPESMPMVVLANEFSASASEIVAGALQDWQRAKIVGEPTYGKGSVQTLIPMQLLPDEQWVDENENGIFDEWEKSRDNVFPNGKHDFGHRIKLTVARYLLPSGRSIHTETDKQGRTVKPGGVFPDEAVEFARVPTWKLEELDRLIDANAFRKYVDDRFEAHREVFLGLAEGDGGEWSRYPDFEEFYASLKTPLDRDEVRRWIRLRVREVVSDERKKVFPGYMFLGDYEEDTQLQRAIRLVLGTLGTDPDSVSEYRVVFAKSSHPAEAPWKNGEAGVGEPK